MRVIDGLLAAGIVIVSATLVIAGLWWLNCLFLIGCFVLWLVLYKGFL